MPNSKVNSFKGLFKSKSSKSNSSKTLMSFPGSSVILPEMGGGDEFDAAPPGKAKQRNSISLNSVGTSLLAGLSDYDSDEDSTGEANKEQVSPVVSNPKASGGPQHRPLVGGFAAAAYEASRMDFYKKQGMEVKGHDKVEKKPKRNLPRYP